jgi:hypothetical protein
MRSPRSDRGRRNGGILDGRHGVAGALDAMPVVAVT